MTPQRILRVASTRRLAAVIAAFGAITLSGSPADVQSAPLGVVETATAPADAFRTAAIGDSTDAFLRSWRATRSRVRHRWRSIA